MSVADFLSYYWRKDELVRFARRLGLSARGHKPELGLRIERRLRGAGDGTAQESKSAKGLRDSDRPLSRETRVVHYKSDTRTRAFFESEIGPEFHFTYHLNQWRLAREDTGNLTYGDLIDEWLAEREHRSGDGISASRSQTLGPWQRWQDQAQVVRYRLLFRSGGALTSITQTEILRASSGFSVSSRRALSASGLSGRTPDGGGAVRCFSISPNQSTR